MSMTWSAATQSLPRECNAPRANFSQSAVHGNNHSIQPAVSALAETPGCTAQPIQIMDNFFKMLDRLGAVLGWIVVAIVVMAIGPIIIKILSLLSTFH